MVAADPIGIAAAIPLLLVPLGDFLGAGQEVHAGAQRLFRMFDGRAPQGGVGFHDGEFMGFEPSRFQQDLVGNADLADIVQRGGFEQHGYG